MTYLTPMQVKFQPKKGPAVFAWKIQHDGISGMGKTPELALLEFLEARRMFGGNPQEKFALTNITIAA